MVFAGFWLVFVGFLSVFCWFFVGNLVVRLPRHALGERPQERGDGGGLAV